MQTDSLEIGGCQVTVERLGSGPPLVVLHGEDGPRNTQAFLEHLSDKFEIHVPRLVGWAGTRRSAHIRNMRDIALVAQEYVERFNRSIPLVGLSLGGWVAAEIAAIVPALVSNLVLISPIGVKIGGREDRDIADIYVLPADQRAALYYAPGRAPKLKPGTNADVFMERAIAEEAVARFCWQPYMHDPGLTGRLRRIRAGTLLIAGERDALVLNPSYYRGYAGLIAGARLETIAGAGHRVEEEEPQKVATRIAEFLARAGSTRTAAA